jgi:hypothetical protein
VPFLFVALDVRGRPSFQILRDPAATTTTLLVLLTPERVAQKKKHPKKKKKKKRSQGAILEFGLENCTTYDADEFGHREGQIQLAMTRPFIVRAGMFCSPRSIR